ncbi:MAG: phosphatase PAP2 family protein [Bryobacterales bacterium]|nr:phosphatase PAP2 family protein [Bryobacterales bacterium]
MAIPGLRRTEWALIVYFAYVSVMARILPVKAPVPGLILRLNLAIAGGYFLLAYADSLRRGRFLGSLRDWYPTALLLLAYREIGWLAPAGHNYALERTWVRWDKVVLNEWGVKALIEFAGPLLPAVLEISYALVYAMPFIGLGALYVCGLRDRADSLMFPLALSVLSAYVLFPYFPSEPPRTVFPGEDFPAHLTVFRRFNWAMLGNYGIHTSVFPSAHVSGSFTVALAVRRLLPGRKWLGRSLLVLAVLITTATVYGRYHYVADAAAGLALALAATAVTSSPWRRPWGALSSLRRPRASLPS